MKINKKVFLSVATATALIATIGVTTYAATTANNPMTRQRNSIWDILTSDQKTQVTNQAKANFEEKLANGILTQEQYDAAITAIENGEMPMMGNFGGHGRMMSSAEQEAMTEFHNKWNNLTDAQRDSIYDLEDEKAAIDAEIIDKYEEYGVIDQKIADDWQTNLETRQSMRTEGKMPCGGRGMRVKGFRGSIAN